MPLSLTNFGKKTMAIQPSAGILLFRLRNKNPEFFLIHPGGPFWKNKDNGAWSIPKGEFTTDEDPLEAAIRELKEETGFVAKGKFIALTPIRQAGGKIVHAWALAADLDPDKIKSNTFEMEWPPRSGRMQHFPEVDRSGWFGIGEAKQKINQSQVALLDELLVKLEN